MINLKRLLTILFAIGCIGITTAQEKFWVGVDLGFNSYKVGEGDALTSLELSPTIGYQVNEKMGIGLNLSYVSPLKDVSAFGFGAFLRYGWGIGDKATLFGDLGVGYASFSDKTGTDEETGSAFNVGISPGFLYRFADKWSAVVHFGNLGFTSGSSKVGDNDGPSTTEFGLNVNMSNVGIGVQYHF